MPRASSQIRHFPRCPRLQCTRLRPRQPWLESFSRIESTARPAALILTRSLYLDLVWSFPFTLMRGSVELATWLINQIVIKAVIETKVNNCANSCVRPWMPWKARLCWRHTHETQRCVQNEKDCGKIMNTNLILVVHVPWNEQTQQRPTAVGCSSYDRNASASFSPPNLRLTDWHMHTELSTRRISRESSYATARFRLEVRFEFTRHSGAIIFLSRGNKV